MDSETYATSNVDDVLFTLSDEKVAEFRDIFAFFDRSGRGVVTPTELGDVMRLFGWNPTERVLQDLISEIDQDGNGCISFNEFVYLMTKNVHEDGDIEEEIREAFRVFDREGNGFITVPDLYRVLTTLGDKLTTEESDELMAEADIDGDGNINYEEFVTMLLRGSGASRQPVSPYAPSRASRTNRDRPPAGGSGVARRRANTNNVAASVLGEATAAMRHRQHSHRCDSALGSVISIIIDGATSGADDETTLATATATPADQIKPLLPPPPPPASPLPIANASPAPVTHKPSPTNAVKWQVATSPPTPPPPPTTTTTTTSPRTRRISLDEAGCSSGYPFNNDTKYLTVRPQRFHSQRRPRGRGKAAAAAAASSRE